MTKKPEKPPVPEDIDINSSVVLRGFDATTFSEMETFVKDLESRQTDRILKDLQQLASLSASKFSLVSYVLVNKYNQASAEEKAKIKQAITDTIATLSPSDESHKRLSGVLARLRR